MTSSYRPVEQAGFPSGFGTYDHLQSITLVENTTESYKPLILALIDFHKAFDTVELKTVMQALQEGRIDFRYSKLIYNIYKNATMTVRLFENTDRIPIGVQKGDKVTQNCS